MNALRRWTRRHFRSLRMDISGLAVGRRRRRDRGTRRPLLRLMAIALLPVALVACDEDSPTEVESPGTITEIAVETPALSTLVAALSAADLAEALEADGPFTVFAPVNSAFTALGGDVVDALLEPGNVDLLTEVLTYHVVAGAAVGSGDLSDGLTVTTLEGETLTIGVNGGTVTAGGATVIQADIGASNGVIHLVDGVLVPETDLVGTAILNDFGTLVDLVARAGLVETLRSDNGGEGFTVFAPTDAAFAELAAVPEGEALARVLTYHVVGATVLSGDLSDGQVVTTVEGGSFTVNIDGSDVTLVDESGNTVNVVATDVSAENGVVHVIDGVLLPG